MLATGLAMSQVLLAVQYGRDHKEKSREGSNRILPKMLKSTSALNEGYRYTVEAAPVIALSQLAQTSFSYLTAFILRRRSY
jgi:hypothetical protein